MARMRVIRPRVVGCTRDERRLIARGPERRRRIALTFDDGPGPYTSQILRILREHDVRATFFVLGHAVGAYPSLARQELRAGHELGNHSMAHRVYPSGSDLGGTSARIRRATGFTPCTFRPPYGALTWATVSSAWSLGMSSILWDVDPMDWALPGSATIESRVLAGARDGSIVLMHDGGGPRGQTVAALPGIIGKLRDRGFRFVTVTELLGERPIWRP
jgi:peptidoglycan/xylan/chitin deacetylase (PgdA/CDA1 family)